MIAQTLTMQLSTMFAKPERDLVRDGMLALIAKEIRAAELEIADIRERYGTPTVPARGSVRRPATASQAPEN